jgi:hypothetical protein
VVGDIPEVRVELPNGLGLSDEGRKWLIDRWTVLRLIQTFISEPTPLLDVAPCAERKHAVPHFGAEPCF